MQTDATIDVRQCAQDAFASGLFCAESVVLAVAQAQGTDSQLLTKMATGFCSGMARTGGTCGALTGAIMGVGLALGRTTAAESVQSCYSATRRVVGEFEQTFGSRDCRALLDGCDLDTAEGQARFKAEKLGGRCRRFTGEAADMAARAIAAERVHP